MARLASIFDRWIWNLVPPSRESLGIFRILFAGYFLLAGMPALVWLGDIPDTLYNAPLGPFQLFTGFPPGWFFHALSLALCLSITALALGYRTRLVSILTPLLMMIGFGFSYSLGKQNSTGLLLLVPLVLSASTWGEAYSLDSLRSARKGQADPEPSDGFRSRWPLALLAFLLGMLMFTAAVPKFTSGWLDTGTQAVRGHFFVQYFADDQRDLLADTFVRFHSQVFWEALDWMTIVLEGGFLFAVLSRRVFRLFLAVAVLFHLGVLSMMNIGFSVNLIGYAAFVNWEPVLAPILRRGAALGARVERLVRGWGAAQVLGVALAYFVLFRLVGRPLFTALEGVGFDPPTIPADVVLMVPATVIAVGYLVTRFTGWRPQRPTAVAPSPAA